MCHNCPICYETLNQQQPNFLRLKCNHEFHFNCIFKLLSTNTSYNNNCPLCREHIVGQSDDKIIVQDQLQIFARQISSLLDINHELREHVNFYKQLFFSLIIIITFIGVQYIIPEYFLVGIIFIFSFISSIIFTIGYSIYIVMSFIYPYLITCLILLSFHFINNIIQI